jgi:hypothetical protein
MKNSKLGLAVVWFMVVLFNAFMGGIALAALTEPNDINYTGELTIDTGGILNIKHGKLQIGSTQVTATAAELNATEGRLDALEATNTVVKTAASGTAWLNKSVVISNSIGQLRTDSIRLTMAGGTNIVTATNGSAEGEKVSFYTFPQGRIMILGAVINAVVTNSLGVMEASANDVFNVSIGSAGAADDATLVGTESDVIGETEIDTVDGTTCTNAWQASFTNSVPTVLDGTTTAAALWWNTGVADASLGSNCNFGVTGTVYVTWTWLGDY